MREFDPRTTTTTFVYKSCCFELSARGDRREHASVPLDQARWRRMGSRGASTNTRRTPQAEGGDRRAATY